MGDPCHRWYSLWRRTGVALLLGGLAGVAPMPAAEAAAANHSAEAIADPDADVPTAPVEIDGTVLFRVRGSSAYPAEKRAETIASRVVAIAADASVPADSLALVETEGGTGIFAGNERVMVVQDADAKLEAMNREALAHSIVNRLRSEIAAYREARSRSALLQSLLGAGGATAIFLAVLALVIWLSRRLRAAVERRFRQRVHALSIQSFQIVRAERLWDAARRMLDGARAVLLVAIAFLYLQRLLGLFPWTRGVANRLLDYVVQPLAAMGHGLVREIPDVIVLGIIFLLTRYLLRVVHLFFGAVGRGEVTLSGFQAEWAEPTYKLLRAGVVAFAVVVGFPYVPGSGSEAFKGVSLFLGIVFSLGSSSAIGNVIAGYTLTYRRAFKLGDRVKIGDTIGDVTQMRLQVTHVKTIKNEEVTIPNSSIINNEVVNYSALTRGEGLILHTTVGIGYETPWRQVEAMLLVAAERTPGLMKDPPPFILQQALGDFAVTYELNVYCDNAQVMARLYTAVHRNILDVFNEYGVQIMTPAYEGDPEQPKLVPKEQWFSAPAKPGGGA